MKKLVLPLLLLLGISMLLAQAVSEPSEVVGYFRLSIGATDFTAFSIPFAYDDQSPDNILSGFGDGDILTDMTAGTNSYYYGVWDGDVTSIDYGNAYWLYREAGNDAMDFYLLGKVDPQSFTLRIKAGPIEGDYTPFSLNEAREVPLSALNIPGVVEGDIITDMQNGDVAYYYGEWDGFAVNTIKPTHTYWYQSMASEGFMWTYTPTFDRGTGTMTSSRSQK